MYMYVDATSVFKFVVGGATEDLATRESGELQRTDDMVPIRPTQPQDDDHGYINVGLSRNIQRSRG